MTSSGLEMPPDQNAFQTWSIWLLMAPVIMRPTMYWPAPPASSGDFVKTPILGAVERCRALRRAARRLKPAGPSAAAPAPSDKPRKKR